MGQSRDMVTQIRTQYGSFTKSYQKLADFILENLNEVAFFSINELSQKAGISPATITRFTRRLGFQGYPDFQRSVYEYQKELAPFGQLKSLIRREGVAKENSPDLLQWTIQNNIHLLEALYNSRLHEAFYRATEILQQARIIYIAGMRSSYATAYYLGFMLQQMRDNVRLLPTSVCDFPTVLSDVRAEDCLVVVSYAKYTRSSYDLVSHFHRVGCKIVAITDSLTSPIARKATEVLIAPNGGNFSPVGAISLCNCFITSLGQLNTQQSLERMERQDQIALEHQVYL